jgi:hypothetical protein
MKYPNGYFKGKACKTCGETFTPTNPCNTYCSDACRGRNSYYKRSYGITESEYEDMKASQGHLCYLCGEEGFVMGDKGASRKALR